MGKYADRVRNSGISTSSVEDESTKETSTKGKYRSRVEEFNSDVSDTPSNVEVTGPESFWKNAGDEINAVIQKGAESLGANDFANRLGEARARQQEKIGNKNPEGPTVFTGGKDGTFADSGIMQGSARFYLGAKQAYNDLTNQDNTVVNEAVRGIDEKVATQEALGNDKFKFGVGAGEMAPQVLPIGLSASATAKGLTAVKEAPTIFSKVVQGSKLVGKMSLIAGGQQAVASFVSPQTGSTVELPVDSRLAQRTIKASEDALAAFLTSGIVLGGGGMLYGAGKNIFDWYKASKMNMDEAASEIMQEAVRRDPSGMAVAEQQLAKGIPQSVPLQVDPTDTVESLSKKYPGIKIDEKIYDTPQKVQDYVKGLSYNPTTQEITHNKEIGKITRQAVYLGDDKLQNQVDNNVQYQFGKLGEKSNIAKPGDVETFTQKAGDQARILEADKKRDLGAANRVIANQDTKAQAVAKGLGKDRSPEAYAKYVRQYQADLQTKEAVAGNVWNSTKYSNAPGLAPYLEDITDVAKGGVSAKIAQETIGGSSAIKNLLEVQDANKKLTVGDIEKTISQLNGEISAAYKANDGGKAEVLKQVQKYIEDGHEATLQNLIKGDEVADDIKNSLNWYKEEFAPKYGKTYDPEAKRMITTTNTTVNKAFNRGTLDSDSFLSNYFKPNANGASKEPARSLKVLFNQPGEAENLMGSHVFSKLAGMADPQTGALTSKQVSSFIAKHSEALGEYPGLSAKLSKLQVGLQKGEITKQAALDRISDIKAQYKKAEREFNNSYLGKVYGSPEQFNTVVAKALNETTPSGWQSLMDNAAKDPRAERALQQGVMDYVNSHVVADAGSRINKVNLPKLLEMTRRGNPMYDRLETVLGKQNMEDFKGIVNSLQENIQLGKLDSKVSPTGESPTAGGITALAQRKAANSAARILVNWKAGIFSDTLTSAVQSLAKENPAFQEAIVKIASDPDYTLKILNGNKEKAARAALAAKRVITSKGAFAVNFATSEGMNKRDLDQGQADAGVPEVPGQGPLRLTIPTGVR